MTRKKQRKQVDQVGANATLSVGRPPTKRERELSQARIEGYTRGRDAAEAAFRNESAVRGLARQEQEAKLKMMQALEQSLRSMAQASDTLARLIGNGF